MDQALTCSKRDIRVTWVPDPLHRELTRSFPFPWLGPSRVCAYAEWLGVPTEPTITARLNGRDLTREEWDWTLVERGDDLRFVRDLAGVDPFTLTGLVLMGEILAKVLITGAPFVITALISTGVSVLA